MELFFFFWLLFTNLLTFVLFTEDKRRSRRRARRISEKTLWCISLLGGGTGAFLAMQIHRHKTRHLSFVLGIPACMVLNLGSVYLLHLYL